MSDEPEHVTPLTEEESDGLIPGHVLTREHLNEWEHVNILEAEEWAFTRGRAPAHTTDFVLELHRRMFNRTWTWAGQVRLSDKNIGVPKEQIWIQLRELQDTVDYWLGNGTFPLRETGARFHHRLVWIHPFPNGNGRLSRLATDVLLVQHGADRFAWGGRGLEADGVERRRYIRALQAADGQDLRPLLEYLGILQPQPS